MDKVFDAIKEAVGGMSTEELLKATEEIRDFIHKEVSPIGQPIDYVRWVPIEKVQANDYNPNSVAKKEMRLLYLSIWNDGYTQPVVTIYDEDLDKYVIIDGFHRYFTCKSNKDVRERNKGMLPIVVLNKTMNERMAATVRHNRARGKHSVKGMSNMVFEMLENGWADAEICNQLGMEPEELLRLKHITGFAKLFEGAEYSKAWETKRQIKIRLDAQKKGAIADRWKLNMKPEDR